jgi:hypothetical protein
MREGSIMSGNISIFVFWINPIKQQKIRNFFNSFENLITIHSWISDPRPFIPFIQVGGEHGPKL